MSRLSIQLLGPFQISLDGQPASGLASDKVRALLAYLAVEADRPHRREKLADLLWPDSAEQAARSSLRRSLWNLRRSISDQTAKPPFLLVSPQTVQFNSDSNALVDVLAFRAALESPETDASTPKQLEKGVALYGGTFLEGFSLRGSVAFEDWALITRERLQRQVHEGLQQLASHYSRRGEYQLACEFAWRQVEMEPWHEQAQQQLMRLLTLAGRRGDALAQYEACRRILANDLGVEPSRQTTLLYERIRDGELRATISRGHGHVGEPRLPPFLREEESRKRKAVFVARQPELAALDRFLVRAMAGEGQMAFVAGEAGSGKTALIEEFARRAQETHDNLLVASGHCNAYIGIGDPYLPFRELLALLSADVESLWAAGTIGREQALRLWNNLPFAVQALIEAGPHLLGTLISQTALLRRATVFEPAGAEWLARLEELLKKRGSGPSASAARQIDLFNQYGKVLSLLARRTPLLLLLDDLQWADDGSVDLLFHLRRGLRTSHILILGAYRPEEIAAGRSSRTTASAERQPHPLLLMLHEVQREVGDISIDLEDVGDRAFVDAYVDSEPNRLGVEFRDMLYRQTRGHALFTVELLQGLQQRGDLILDDSGQWVAAKDLDWESLPPRIEGLIGQRIGRIPKSSQTMLRAASVQGEVFTAEVLARAQGLDERETVHHLSGELSRGHRLLSPHSVVRLGEQSLSRYRFRHILFQRYLYKSLDPVETPRLHQSTATVLEELYQDRTEEIAVQLARHFREAGMDAKAVQYLSQAGERAIRLSANQEAIEHYSRALALLEKLPQTRERAESELALQLSLAVPILATKTWGAPEAAQAYDRARELSEKIGDSSELLRAMIGERYHRTVRAEHPAAIQLAKQIYSQAQASGETLQVMLGHMELAVALVFVGEFAASLAHIERFLALYDSELHGSLAFQLGQDPAVASQSLAIYDLWFLGYPDRAVQRAEAALALAKELDHPFTTIFASEMTARLYRWRSEPDAVHQLAEALLRLGPECGMELSDSIASIHRSWVLSEHGQHLEGVSLLTSALDGWKAMGMANHLPEFLGVLAEMQGKAGQTEVGLDTLDQALEIVNHTEERYYEAELYGLRGKLLMTPDVYNREEAEASFLMAILIARQHRARMSELRAIVGLCRLWLAQDIPSKRIEGHQMLADIYGWFTEGFDTRDLVEAKALLEELESTG